MSISETPEVIVYLSFFFNAALLTYIFFLQQEIKELRNLNRSEASRFQFESENLNKFQMEQIEKIKAEKPKKTESKELIDFLKDMKIHGYGVIRVNPDSVFYSGREA